MGDESQVKDLSLYLFLPLPISKALILASFELYNILPTSM